MESLHYHEYIHNTNNDDNNNAKSATCVLIYNVSHSDLLVTYQAEGADEPTLYDAEHPLIARPTYGNFYSTSEKALRKLASIESKTGICTASIAHESNSLVLGSQEIMSGVDDHIIGFSLQGGSIIWEDVNGYQLRPVKLNECSPSSQEDRTKYNPSESPEEIKSKRNSLDSSMPEGNQSGVLRRDSYSEAYCFRNVTDRPPARINLVGVYFPVYSVLLPDWIQRMESHYPNANKVIYLVSGSGSSRRPGYSSQDNSTEGTAYLLRKFTIHCFGKLIKSVDVAHSGPGIESYAENVKFINAELKRHILAWRQDVVVRFGEGWNKKFQVSIALTNGAPARVSAINAALREFIPDYLHITRPKNFWYEGNLCAPEYHDNDTIEATPAVGICDLDPFSRRLVDEMVNYRRSFEIACSTTDHELKTFWLRKTNKPVLAVLATWKEGDTAPRFFRGLNIEVSMPTGSLCSERNAFGTALAADPTLRRSDIKMIAVLSGLHLTHEEAANTKSQSCIESNGIGYGDSNPLSPCGSCTEWLRKIAEVNPLFSVFTFQSYSCEKVFIQRVH